MLKIVQPQGWNDWKKPETHQTARYAEFHSTGPGANPPVRAPWSRQLTPNEANAITLTAVLAAVPTRWNPNDR